MQRGVGVGICREGPIQLRRLVNANPGANFIVVVQQAARYRRVGLLLHRRKTALLHSQQQLRHHVPVNRAQSFVGEKGSRATGKGFVVKGLFVQIEQKLPLLLCQPGIGAACQGIQPAGQVFGIFELPVEMEAAANVALHDAAIAVAGHLFDQLRTKGLGGIDVVFLQKPGKLLVRIENVAVLVRPEEGAAFQAVQHIQCLCRTQQTRAQHGDLALEHFAQVGAADALAGLHHQVVGVVKLVRALVGADGMVEIIEAKGRKSAELSEVNGLFFAAKTLLVNPGAIVGSSCTQAVEHGLAVGIAERPGQEAMMSGQGRFHLMETKRQFRRDFHRTRFAISQQALEKGHEPPQVIKSHHRDAIAHKGVVGVVPLGSLGVHPDACLRDQVRDLGQYGSEDFFEEIHPVHLLIGQGQQGSVGTDLLPPGADGGIPVVVEVDGVLRGLQELFVGFDEVGNGSIDKPVLFKQTPQAARRIFFRELQKFEQVNDLVVAPVADVGPGIVGLDGFPVKSAFGDPVGVVAIEGGGVEKPENHAGHELGVGMCQGLPVLKNVAPVALVVKDLGAVSFVLGVDGEFVPGAAGVAVAAAELERQVLQAQPDQVRVLALIEGIF